MPTKRKKRNVKQGMEDIKLLIRGYRPRKTKIGSDFKGKNKIIIAEKE